MWPLDNDGGEIMDSNAFLAGLAVGRRLKGWACGGDLRVNIGTGGNDEKDEP